MHVNLMEGTKTETKAGGGTKAGMMGLSGGDRSQW